MFLEKILAARRASPHFLDGPSRLPELRRQAAGASPVRDFAAALLGGRPAVIAEIKRASPSKGDLRPDLDPAELARAYERGGAAALSVLTEGPHFRGTLQDLRSAREACDLPVLRKDFLLQEWEVVEARAAGADAVLLIVAALPPERLRAMLEAASDQGLAALVEVHDEGELELALAAGARIVGINNRDLRSFRVDLETTRRLAPRIPDGVIRVSESGIARPEDLRNLGRVEAVLVGESLVTSPDPETALRMLRSGATEPAPPGRQ